MILNYEVYVAMLSSIMEESGDPLTEHFHRDRHGKLGSNSTLTLVSM